LQERLTLGVSTSTSHSHRSGISSIRCVKLPCPTPATSTHSLPFTNC